MTSFNQILIANMGLIDTFACQTHFQSYVCSQSLTKINAYKTLQLNRIHSTAAIDIAEYFIFVYFIKFNRFDIDSVHKKHNFVQQFERRCVHVRNLRILYFQYFSVVYASVHSNTPYFFSFCTYVNSCVVSLSTLYKLRDV